MVGLHFSLDSKRSLSKDWNTQERLVLVLETISPVSEPTPLYPSLQTYSIPLEEAFADICKKISDGLYTFEVGFPDDEAHQWQAIYAESFAPDQSYHSGVIVIHYEQVAGS